MLVYSKQGADFSRGCAGAKISHSILKTHPHRFANQFLLTPVAARRTGLPIKYLQRDVPSALSLTVSAGDHNLWGFVRAS
jgi:hypothetical protein